MYVVTITIILEEKSNFIREQLHQRAKIDQMCPNDHELVGVAINMKKVKTKQNKNTKNNCASKNENFKKIYDISHLKHFAL